MKKTEVIFLCPFDLDILTGTPIRAKTVISHTKRKFVVVSINRRYKNQAEYGILLIVFVFYAIYKLFRKRPKIIHCFTTAAILPALFYRFFKRDTKVIFEMHGIPKYEMRDSPFPLRALFGYLDKIGVIHSDRIIVMSYVMRRFLREEYHIEEEKISVIWGPIDCSKFVYKEPKLHKKLVVGYAGNDYYWQGIEIILGAYEKLRNRGDILFTIIGLDREKYKEFEKGNIVFLGKIEHDRISTVLSKCDVLLSMRIGDYAADLQYPQKLSSYLATGRPVIVTDVSDQKMIIKEVKCGIVIEPRVNELIDAILSFKELGMEEWTVMGENARKFAEKTLDINKIIDIIDQIYKEMD